VTRRHIHYEAAFEDYLRSQGLPYIAVDEKKKAIFSGARIKSFDFLLYRPDDLAWLVDVKGRKFPYDVTGGRRYWENWITRDDLTGLTEWQRAFGEGFCAMLVFAYWLTGSGDRLPTAHVHAFRDEYYSFLCITLDDYATHARQRSAKWQTVTVPAPKFRELAKPIQHLLGS
jgi:hypothetical protein